MTSRLTITWVLALGAAMALGGACGTSKVTGGDADAASADHPQDDTVSEVPSEVADLDAGDDGSADGDVTPEGDDADGADGDLVPDDDGNVDGDGSIDGDGQPPFVPCTGDTLMMKCAKYCGTVRVACTGPNVQFPGADQFAQDSACLAACPTWACGHPGDSTGNSLNCRISSAFDVLDAIDASAPALEIQTKCQAAGPSSPVCM